MLQRDTPEWEALCQPSAGCGIACCFFEGEPCEALAWQDEAHTIGRCTIYATRFGERQTTGGKVFRCATMAERLLSIPAPERCGYATLKPVVSSCLMI
jgi:hypothetical protein